VWYLRDSILPGAISYQTSAPACLLGFMEKRKRTVLSHQMISTCIASIPQPPGNALKSPSFIPITENGGSATVELPIPINLYHEICLGCLDFDFLSLPLPSARVPGAGPISHLVLDLFYTGLLNWYTAIILNHHYVLFGKVFTSTQSQYLTPLYGNSALSRV
jgi:hypothetical protein